MTPGVAPEKKFANRLANEGELSDDPTLEASEQPDSIAALTISARRTARAAAGEEQVILPDQILGIRPSQGTAPGDERL